jgi:GTP-binding protein HflX
VIAINKADIAKPELMMELLRREPQSYAISVKSGFGIEGLIHAIEKSLPHPGVEIDAVIPYERGDLVHAIHESGEIHLEEHLAEGTHIKGYVDASLAQSISEAVANIGKGRE